MATSSATSTAMSSRQTHQRHRRAPSIPLRVRSTSLGDPSVATVVTTLSPSSAEIPPAEPFRASAQQGDGTSSYSRSANRNVHAALPQKASEKYGFVVYVGSLLAWYLYLFWAFTPDRYIKALGIEWYPDRQWALLVPSWIMICVVYVYIAYFSLNLYQTPDLSSMTCIYDTQGKMHPAFTDDPSRTADYKIPPYSIKTLGLGYEEDYIPPLYDLPVRLINEAVFGS